MHPIEFFKQKGIFKATPVREEGKVICWRLSCNGNYISLVKCGNRAGSRGSPTVINSFYSSNIESTENERLFAKLDTLVNLCFRNGVDAVRVER